MGRPAGMQRLHRRTLVHELHDTAGLAAGDAQRVRHLLTVEPHHEAGGERASERPAHRGELEAASGERAGRGEPQPHKHFPAEDKGSQKAGAGRARLLGDGKRRRCHDGSAMRDGSGMRTVIFERVHERPVAQRRRSRGHC